MVLSLWPGVWCHRMALWASTVVTPWVPHVKVEAWEWSWIRSGVGMLQECITDIFDDMLAVDCAIRWVGFRRPSPFAEVYTITIILTSSSILHIQYHFHYSILTNLCFSMLFPSNLHLHLYRPSTWWIHGPYRNFLQLVYGHQSHGEVWAPETRFGHLVSSCFFFARGKWMVWTCVDGGVLRGWSWWSWFVGYAASIWIAGDICASVALFTMMTIRDIRISYLAGSWWVLLVSSHV